MMFLVKDGRFGYASGNGFMPLTPVSRDEYVSKRYLYRFVRDAAGHAVSVIRLYDGTVWTLGSSPGEAKGPGKPEWTRFLGSYVRKRFGVGEKFYNVSVKNGWLHFQGDGQDFRLSEHRPGSSSRPTAKPSICAVRCSPSGTSRCTSAGTDGRGSVRPDRPVRLVEPRTAARLVGHRGHDAGHGMLVARVERRVRRLAVAHAPVPVHPVVGLFDRLDLVLAADLPVAPPGGRPRPCRPAGAPVVELQHALVAVNVAHVAELLLPEFGFK